MNTQTEWVYYQGFYLKSNELKISVLNSAFLYGESLFESCWVEKGKILFLKEHVERLKLGFKVLHWNLSLSEEEILKIFSAFENRSEDGILKIHISAQKNAYEIKNKNEFTFLVFWQACSSPYSQAIYKDGIICRLSHQVKTPSSFIHSFKHGSYLNSILALKEKKEDHEEILLCNEHEQLCEGASSNLFFVKKNIIYSPSLKQGVLAGVCREKIIQKIKQLKIPFHESSFTLEEIEECDEIFLSSSIKIILSVSQIYESKYQRKNQSMSSMLREKILEES